MTPDEKIAAWDALSKLCMSIAPSRIAVTVPPSSDGLHRTPWCHLRVGHGGPCRCGEMAWDVTDTRALAALKEKP